MKESSRLPGAVLILFASFLTASIVFVGLAIAQETNCTVDPNGEGCTGGNITVPTEPGNYTYTACIDRNNNNINDTGECVNVTVEVVSENLPIANIDEAPDKINFGDTASFTGSGSYSKDIASYAWESDIDGLIGVDTSFETSSLSVGKHTITLAVTGVDEAVSPLAEKTVIVSPPWLGNPVKVVPRIITEGNTIRLYNMPAGALEEIYCQISTDGTEQACSDASPTTIEECPAGAKNIPVIEIQLAGGLKKVNLTVAESAAKVGQITKKPAIQGGELTLTVTPPTADGTSTDFGLLGDSDFLPSGLKVDVSSSAAIDSIDSTDFTKGVFFALHKVSNCGLTELKPLTALAYKGAAKDKFTATIPLPTDCATGTCKYIFELVGVGSAGGQIAEFEYQKSGAGVLTLSPENIDFGQLLAGDVAQKTVTITNVGTADVANLAATTTSAALTLSLDKESLAPQESAILTVSLITTPATPLEAYSDYISVSATADTQPVTVAITASYQVVSELGALPAAGILVATPSSVNFGQLKAGDTTTQIVSISNEGAVAVSEIDVVTPPEIIGTLQVSSLGAGESTTLNLLLKVPDDAVDGEQTGVVDLVAGGGETLSIPISYTVGAVTKTCPSAKPPTCKANEKLSSKTDEDGCAAFICVAKAVKKLPANVTDNVTGLPPEKKPVLSLPLIISIIIIALAVAFGLLIAAVREGWINLDDYPWLRDLLKKAGLGALFEKEEAPRFTPRPPTAPAGAPRPPPYRPPPGAGATRPAPVRRELTPGDRARLEKYMREHPEYAAWVKKRYGLK